MAVSIPYTTTWVSNQILTAAALNQNFLDVENISGLGTANLDANAGITAGQLAVGAAVNTAASAAINTGLVIQNVETAVVTLPSITTRGGRVVIFGYGGLSVNAQAATNSDITFRVYRGVTVIETVVFSLLGLSASGGTTANFPIGLPLFSETPTAGSYVYKITAQTTAAANIAVISNATNAGHAFVIELS